MNDQIKDMGMRLSFIRQDCEVPVEKMAQKLGISTEEYKAYERGEIDFSFSFLLNAAEILGVDVLEIISGSSPTLSMCCMVEKGKGFSVKRETGYDYKHLAYTFKNNKADPLLVTSISDDKPVLMHKHEGQEFNYVLSGKITFYIGDISYELEAGDSVYFDSGVPHAQKGKGEEPAQYIAVVIKN